MMLKILGKFTVMHFPALNPNSYDINNMRFYLSSSRWNLNDQEFLLKTMIIAGFFWKICFAYFKKKHSPAHGQKWNFLPMSYSYKLTLYHFSNMFKILPNVLDPPPYMIKKIDISLWRLGKWAPDSKTWFIWANWPKPNIFIYENVAVFLLIAYQLKFIRS